ncbi:hypothetical protein D3C76_364150 [compost metagenome]
MVHGVHLPGTHHVQHLGLVAYRAEDRDQLHGQAFADNALLQFTGNGVQVEFAVLEQQQGAWRLPEDLAAQFGADRAAGTGHHHRLVDDAVLQQVALRRHRVAAQQVGDVHFLDVVHLDPAAGQVHEARHTAHMQRVAFQQVENFAAAAAADRGQRQQDFSGAGVVDHALQLFRLVHLQAGDHPVGNAGIVVDERNRAHGLAHAQRRHQLVTGRAGTVDGHPWQAVVAVGKGHVLHGGGKPVTEEVLAHGQAQAANHDQAQPPVVEGDRARHHVLVVAGPVDDEAEDQRRQGHCLDDGNQRVIAEIAHHCPVQAKADEQRDRDDRRGDEQPGVVTHRVGQVIDAQAHEKRQPQREPDQNDIGRYLDQPFVASR